MEDEDTNKKSPKHILDNAAQAWNHTFYWNSLTPKGVGKPSGALATAIEDKWGAFPAFREAFAKSAVGNFGSGWTWLVQKPDKSLDIVNTRKAGTPLTRPNRP